MTGALQEGGEKRRESKTLHHKVPLDEGARKRREHRGRGEKHAHTPYTLATTSMYSCVRLFGRVACSPVSTHHSEAGRHLSDGASKCHGELQTDGQITKARKAGKRKAIRRRDRTSQAGTPTRIHDSAASPSRARVLTGYSRRRMAKRKREDETFATLAPTSHRLPFSTACACIIVFHAPCPCNALS